MMACAGGWFGSALGSLNNGGVRKPSNTPPRRGRAAQAGTGREGLDENEMRIRRLS